MWLLFVIAAIVFGLAILGLAVGGLLGGRCLRGSCGGLAALDENGRSICGLCGRSREEGEPPQGSAAGAQNTTDREKPAPQARSTAMATDRDSAIASG